MPNELIINVTFDETRVARLENGVVAEVYIERAKEVSVVGNIYKGKVVRSLPGMQAAFVDIGLEKAGFIHASALLSEDDLFVDGDSEGGEARSKRLQIAFKNAQLPKEGTEVIVQVTKDPMVTKGARLTSFVSIPGRYLVYLPTVDHIGVSRRIESDEERARLRSMMEELRPEGVGGFIVRTASEGATRQELVSDIAYLTRVWREIEERAKRAEAPALVYTDLDVTLRIVRDYFTEDIDRLLVDSMEEYERIREFVERFDPKLKDRVEYWSADEPIFDAFGIEVEITRALGQKVWLKSGGYIIIEQTEALTAIDVNTGKFVGKRTLEETILKTNLEAAREIAYQLRLRNIGGIIILDFIDMEKPANRDKVYNALVEALKGDRAKPRITKISSLGLVEMVRKRTRENVRDILADPCFYCEGKGYLKSARTLCYDIFREIKREAVRMDAKEIVVYAHPTVANMLCDEERRGLEGLEAMLGKKIIVEAMPHYHIEQFDIVER